MKQNAMQDWEAVLERLAALQAVHCGLLHEQVVWDEKTQLPMPSANPSGVFERRGLCPANVRQLRLGCGHTNVRNEMRSALQSLMSESDVASVQTIATLLDDLNSLDFDLCRLDHQKGFAEAALAEKAATLAAKVDRASPEYSAGLCDEQSHIRQLVAQHSIYVGRMSHLRDEILALVQRQLAASTKRMT